MDTMFINDKSYKIIKLLAKGKNNGKNRIYIPEI